MTRDLPARARLVVALGAQVIGLATTATLLAPAAPAHAASCEQGTGVTVLVDFASLGGGVQTGCAEGDPSSGVAALQSAGFPPERAVQQPGYFVCRISGKPASDPCQRASPSNAYWSYWHAEPGGSWSFSNTGPAGYDPRPGTVEGWAFGSGQQPSSPPPAERSAPPPPAEDSPPSDDPAPAPAQPAPAQPGSAKPGSAQPGSGQSGSAPPEGGSPGDTSAGRSPVPTAGGDATTAPGKAAAPPGATLLGTEGTDDDEPPAAVPFAGSQPTDAGRRSDETESTSAVDRSGEDGLPTGPIAAGGLVALLSGAAGWQLWRRRLDAEPADAHLDDGT